MSSILVIGDLHLSPDRPDITQCFFEFLACQRKRHQALYIIGDLFESWVGDDDICQFTDEIAKAINTFSKDTPVYFIHGNRDFLLGKKYAQRCGMTLLPEQIQIQAFNKNIMLMHGDQLCLDDIDYQKFRRKSRSWWWQALVTCLPLAYRKNKATEYRRRSISSQMNKSEQIMDVSKPEVDRIMIDNKIDWLVHGHTHRPNVHQLNDDKQRIVVGDWYEQGSVLTLTEQGAHLSQLPFHQ